MMDFEIEREREGVDMVEKYVICPTTMFFFE